MNAKHSASLRSPLNLRRARRSFCAHRTTTIFAAATLGLGLLAGPVRAAFTIVADHGPASNRVNAFFLGDGYTAADIAAGKYAAHVQSYVNYMFSNTLNSDPFYRYRNFFDIYSVNVTSPQSGADEPQNGIVKNTALDATYRFDGTTDRLLYINDAKADAALNAAIVGSGITPKLRFLTVNDAVYGGGGGKYAVYAGANSSAREIALHEMAHSFSGLADEYGGTGTYAGSEPTEVNVTKNATGAKWSRWVGYNDPTGSVVGAYEGGRYFDHGIYRPTLDSKMRDLGVPFNAIDREKLILSIYAIVRPLDSFTPNATTLVNPASLSVARVDDAVINTQWFVDGVMESAFNSLSGISFAGLGLTPGAHSVEVRAFDPTGFDPINGWVRTGTSRLEQFVTWNVLLSVPEPGAWVLVFTLALAYPPPLRRGRWGCKHDHSALSG